MTTPISLYQAPSEKIIRYSLNNAIPALEILEKKLKERGIDFHRNFSVSNYMFDFYCAEQKIAIEIDGYAHEFPEIYSKDAPKKLQILSLGITVFRFTDYQILTDVEEIMRALKYHTKLTNPTPYVV